MCGETENDCSKQNLWSVFRSYDLKEFSILQMDWIEVQYKNIHKEKLQLEHIIEELKVLFKPWLVSFRFVSPNIVIVILILSLHMHKLKVKQV